MKKFFLKKSLILSMLLSMCLLVPQLSKAVPIPKGNDTFLANEEYKSTQDAFAAALAGAKTVLDKKSFDKLNKDLVGMVKQSAQNSIDSGQSPEDAWIGAYAEATTFALAEAKFEYLRKNTPKAQGYYNAENGFDGYLLMQLNSNGNSYTVEFNLVQKGGAYNSGSLTATVTDGGKGKPMQIVVSDADKESVDAKDKNSVVGEILLKGDTATVSTTPEFKNSGMLGHGVRLDGKYTRVKKK